MNYIILENIRSAYNVGNLIRTADAMGWWVVISGYTPHPARHPRVAKSALWADQSVDIVDFGITPDDDRRPRHLVYPQPKNLKKQDFSKKFYDTKSIAEEFDTKKISDGTSSLDSQNPDDIESLNISIAQAIPTDEAIHRARDNNLFVVVAEKTDTSLDILKYVREPKSDKSFAVVLGNEVNWVKSETIAMADRVLYIPMLGTKESLNVWQAWAIFMRELSQKT